MGRIKFSIHPLFFLFGLYFAVQGKVFSFLTVTLTAVIHEFGHSVISDKLGYRLKKITLMPYGAVISGDLTGLKYKDEIKIALAGPITNLCIAVFFIALWWLFPELYAYTDTVVWTNLSIAVINFIPAYPLDGGRILQATLSLVLSREKALKIVKVSGIIFAFLLVGLFVITVFSEVNFSILFFAGFILFGAIDSKNDNKYVRIYNSYGYKNVVRGAEIKRLAVYKTATVKDLISRIDGECMYEIDVVGDDGEVIKRLNTRRVLEILQSKSIYEKILD